MTRFEQQGRPVFAGAGSLAAFSGWLQKSSYSQVAVLADANTVMACVPVLKQQLNADFSLLTIPAGEHFKNLDTCKEVWLQMQQLNFRRNSLLINLGGGVVNDLGAFVASTYLRGIDFVQMPTSLLAMVDAGIGGKTGVDLMNMKNRIGTFAFPVCTVCDPVFLATLNKREWVEGSAEIYKHAIIGDRMLWHSLQLQPVYPELSDEVLMAALDLKLQVVNEDPEERGRRKILNFGHTIGHAYESFCLSEGTPVSHGQAIAMGMQVESILALRIGLLAPDEYQSISLVLNQVFGSADLGGLPVSDMLQRMRFDKKNSDTFINFSLPDRIGHCLWDQFVEESLLREVLISFNATEG